MDEAKKERRWTDRAGGFRRQRSDDGDLDARHRAAERHDVAADAREDQAQAADREAATRDRAASARDAVAETHELMRRGPGGQPSVEQDRARRDRHESARDRTAAGYERDRARRDRTKSGNDRDRAAGDRGAAAPEMIWWEQLVRAEDMLLIGRAQERIMQTQHVGAYEALMAVFTRAARDGNELGAAARSIIIDEPAFEEP